MNWIISFKIDNYNSRDNYKEYYKDLKFNKKI